MKGSNRHIFWTMLLYLVFGSFVVKGQSLSGDSLQRAVSLRVPDNVKRVVEYDAATNSYLIRRQVGGVDVEVPQLMTADEYLAWSMQRSLQSFYRQKNSEEAKAHKDEFDFMDMKFNLGPAEKVFGPGGIRIRTRGSAELSFGMNYKHVNNPALPENQRKTWGFDFDEQVNVNVQAQVGDKVDFNMNYNTDATFDFDTKRMKLKYEGKEDEIIQLLEVGNVSIASGNSLIRGASALFGIRADLKFGKLKLQTVVSQQESEAKTVTSKGGAQTIPFDLTVDNYEENRHFFLAHYFRDTYDKNMAQLPNILSGITISRIEVWVTNKRGNYDNPRNIVALADLGEAFRMGNSVWGGSGNASSPMSVENLPANGANTQYLEMVSTYAAARNITQVTSVLSMIPGMESSMDYEKMESARLLSPSEYTLNSKLGYISLKQTLQADEVLAVAFEYTMGGKSYQVGEFSGDIKDSGQALFVKLLKNTSNTPESVCWDLMMKNVYSLNAYSVQQEKFQLNITYQSDTAGVHLRYLPEGTLARIPLISVMGLDRLNSRQQQGADGFFDFVEGYTISASDGRIFFPVVEPFGEHLKKQIANDKLAEKYVFSALYDSTRTVASQIADKNKFRLTGEFRASVANEIRLGATNIPVGSVRVTAGGVTLTENSDYMVDYMLGVVTILNQSIIDAGTAINVDLESNTFYSMQRKNMMGVNFAYDFNPNLQLGGTLMHLSEKAMTSKVAMGSEPLKNTLWGVNALWKRESQWLTDVLDKLPFVEATRPSLINLGVEFAHLIPGHSSDIQLQASYLDDFESTQHGIDLRTPSYWMLSSTPYNPSASALFPEARLTGDTEYGKNRALLAWYHVDRLFTRRNSSLTPVHIKNDLNQLSNHYVREVYEQELFPNRETAYQESASMNVLNVAFYPSERGPYNLDVDLNADGTLRNPERRWGGMMRKLETSDFETANIEYVTFWLLDPFLYEEGIEGGTLNTTGGVASDEGGDFYINLGEVSEDILKDGKKSFENGLPVDDNEGKTVETVWGRVPRDRSIVYAFDNTSGARSRQDVGLNGLSSADEQNFSTYSNYLQTIQPRLTTEAFEKFRNDPAGDNYHYYRGSDYDAEERSILNRYKYFNNTEGNSTASEDSPERYDISAKTLPDVEDINQDNTLNETEKYYQYRISLRPADMVVGRNYITDKRTVSVRLRNGTTEEVTWYQFKVPVRDGEAIGNIRDFRSIRFMRMFLTNFSKPVVLRFATLELIRGEWRTYTDLLQNQQTNTAGSTVATLEVSAVNIEENADRTPVNYLLPPGISRVIDPGQPQLRQQNEQAMSLKVKELYPGEARAVYKNTSIDMRQYRRLQMFTHAEALPDYVTHPQDGELSVFVRLGSDYQNNYYEYEIPLQLTPHGSYSGTKGQKEVWPSANELDIDLSVLTNAKKNRNRLKNLPGSNISYGKLYSEYDPEKPGNKVSIIGNPTLAEVRTMMIGVRNNARSTKSVEVWVNELRLTDFNEDGGWATQGNLNVQLSDLGAVNLAGHYETAGFGGLEQSVGERRLDDLLEYSVTTTIDLGRFFPKKAKLSIPVYYSYVKEQHTPQYNPLDKDMLLDDALDALPTGRMQDSLLHIAREVSTSSNFSISNMRVDINSKKPMPYDPSNFTFSYSQSKRSNSGSTTAYEDELDWRGSLSYQYTPVYQPWSPFKAIKSNSSWLKGVKDFKLNWLPQSIAFNTDISRHYYELQLRDMEAMSSGMLQGMQVADRESIPVSFAKDFLWNRDFALRWDVTRNLQMNFTSATRAEIEEPYGVVNENLYPDKYSAWKDSVQRSLLRFGRPMDYQQTFNVSLKLPFDKLPLLNWMSGDARFASSYNWDRGVDLNDGVRMGNTISNQRSIDLNGRFNLEALYNKIPYLKKVNRHFSTSKRSAQVSSEQPVVHPQRTKTTVAQKRVEEKKRMHKQRVQLKADSAVVVKHNLNTRHLKLTATRENGRSYKLKYKVLTANTIRLDSRDTSRIELTLLPVENGKEDRWTKVARYAARLAMSVRNFSISYKSIYAMTLPGFYPEVGDMFGQKQHNKGLAPGLGFAFGMTDDNYIHRAMSNGWLLCNDSVVTPAGSNRQEDFQFRMSLEPMRDLKIDLTAHRTRNQSREVQFMFDGMPESRSGNFSMSVITLGSAFERRNADKGYSSSAFETFRNNLDVIHQRVEAQYHGAPYPKHSKLAGQTFDPKHGSVSKYSPDVMIPAFLATYTGRDATRTGLDFFPNLLSMLPNWRITYAGLGKLPWLSKYFRNINLNHAYRSTYAVGSYNTFQSFMSYMGNIGFVEDVQSGNPVPTSRFDVNMVSINEQFVPLIGVDMTWKNGMTTRLEWRMTRVMNLSMTALQLVETTSKDVVLGVGYKIVNFNSILRGTSKHKKNKSGHDLTLRTDVSFRNQSALCRDVQAGITQATSGNKALKITCTADYNISRMLTLRLYYEREQNTPLVSSTSFPVVNADFGFSMKFSLNR